jgi:hypothetical protein
MLKKEMSLATGLILLAAVLLCGGASHILARDLAVSTALLLGSLGFLAWGIINGLKSEDEKSTPNTPPGDIGPVTFGKFNRADDKFPWCVATKYAIAYEVNGVVSELSAESQLIQCDNKTDPIFRVNIPPTSAALKWYRAVAPNLSTWVDHTEYMVPFGNNVSIARDFMDTDNPCQTPYLPDPPPRPVPAGTLGDNMFTMTAGEGDVPWCIPTRYYARYVSNGQESQDSDMSVDFQSNSFTFPRLTVPELPGHTVNWYREVGAECQTFITLPRTSISPNPLDFITIFPFMFGSNTFGRFLDFRDGNENQTTITMCLRELVNTWNATPPIPGSIATGGQLRITGGRLVMDPILVPGGIQTPITFFQGTPTWWTLMGFSATGLTTNATITAVNPPSNQLSGQTAPIGTGSVFTDTQNPCQMPNPPTSAPAFERFNHPF